ncbi:MAG: metallophosphoesterase [Anaerolineales bacterium]
MTPDDSNSRPNSGKMKIPPDRADGSSSWVHAGLIFSGVLGQIEPLVLLPVWLASVAISAWPWPNQLRLPAAAMAALFLASDGAMLALLPRAKRSWGPVTPPLLALTGARILIFWLMALVFPANASMIGLSLAALMQLALGATAIYATWIEPFRLGVTRARFAHPRGPSRPLRLLHISDLHIEGWSPREDAVLAQVEALLPDLIVVTGDYLNLSSIHDPAAQRDVRALLSRLDAPLGVYAISGSPVVDQASIIGQLLSDLPLRWLQDEGVAIQYGDRALWLMGVRNTYLEARDAAAIQKLMAQAPPDALTVLLYHTPDLMPLARDLGVDLYLCGHTHGGQLRLPLYGAIATSSKWGKRYEMGRYREGETTLYVSRGLGVEGLGAPRARFLSPPEIILWEIGNSADSAD